MKPCVLLSILTNNHGISLSLGTGRIALFFVGPRLYFMRQDFLPYAIIGILTFLLSLLSWPIGFLSQTYSRRSRS